MSISTILDVVIGLTAIFFVFSVVASGIHEAITRALATRSKQFWRAMASLLDEPNAVEERSARISEIAFGLNGSRDPRPPSASHATAAGPLDDSKTVTLERFVSSDLIRGLDGAKQLAKTRLSHIEPDLFSRALLDVVSGNQQLEDTAAARAAIERMPDSKLKRDLEALVRHTGDEIGELRDEIGRWFDVRMTALSRSYRRRTRWWVFAIGLVVAVAFNVNAVRVTNTLYRDQAVRSAVTAQAESLVADCEPAADGGITDGCEARIDSAIDTLELPVWWRDDSSITFWTIAGWIAAAAAIAQGAPFWFDVLRRAAGFKRGAMSSH